MKIKRYIFATFLVVLVVFSYRFSTHPKVLLFFYPEKIWVHRVNSLEKLEEVKSKFSGVELDVVWEENHFDVNHPPAKSINLSLTEYLYSVKRNDLGIWLDFKNLDSSNTLEALKKMDYLVKKFRLEKKNIIIESPEPKFLDLFKENGYLTSYYLPFGASSYENDELQKFVEKVRKKSTNYPTNYFSATLGEYVYIKDLFPEQKLLLWHLGGFETAKNKRRIYKALLDKNVKVVLLPYRSESGNR